MRLFNKKNSSILGNFSIFLVIFLSIKKINLFNGNIYNISNTVVMVVYSLFNNIILIELGFESSLKCSHSNLK